MAKAIEIDSDDPQSYATSNDAPSLSSALRQKRRSRSSASASSNPSTFNLNNRNRTTSGPTSPVNDQQTIYSQDQSTSKFVTSSSDFHLPQRTLQSFGYSPSLISPTSNSILSAGDESNIGNVSLPLLRRKAAAAALAHATRKGLRRGSMLGKEVAKDAEEEESNEEEEDMMEEQQGINVGNKHMTEEDQDDDMQIDTGDVTVAGVELESGGKTTGSSSPPNLALQKRSGSTTAVRRVVQRRANLLPRDRGVLRVAASLRDETRPAEGEIASEAKLQRRLAPESDSVAPTTPKLLAQRSQSPFGPSSGSLFDRGIDGDDFIFPDGATAYDLSDDSDYDGDDDMVNTKTTSTAQENESVDTCESGIAIPGANGETQQKGKLWLNFREGGGNPRLSPGAERTSTRSRHRSVTPGGINMTGPLSGSLGSTLDQTMDLEPLYSRVGSSPSLWGKSAKRKVGDERYDPYSYSALHKRRAVSPIAFVSAVNVHVRGHSNTNISPLLNHTSPMHIQAAAATTASSNQSSNCALPTPTPLSIPSPTLSISRGPGGLSGSFPRNITCITTSRAAVTYSANPSPSNTRPSTPTNSIPPNQFGSGPSPSLLSSSASKAATGAPGGGGNGNGGSGPGYGSGALGLSLGGGSKRYKEEQKEMEEEEGMLGDVSAIKL